MSKTKSLIMWAKRPLVVKITKEQENFIREDMMNLGMVAVSNYIRSLIHWRMKSSANESVKIDQ